MPISAIYTHLIAFIILILMLGEVFRIVRTCETERPGPYSDSNTIRKNRTRRLLFIVISALIPALYILTSFIFYTGEIMSHHWIFLWLSSLAAIMVMMYTISTIMYHHDVDFYGATLMTRVQQILMFCIAVVACNSTLYVALRITLHIIPIYILTYHITGCLMLTLFLLYSYHTMFSMIRPENIPTYNTGVDTPLNNSLYVETVETIRLSSMN